VKNKEMYFGLKRKLIESVRRNRGSGLLFSGGLDSAILAGIDTSITPKRCSAAATVSLGSYGEDSRYAKLVAKNLKLKHNHRIVDIDEAIDSIPAVIKILKSFDPAIPNDLAVYFGLESIKEMGIKEIMTGDGADEIFAGYDFMRSMKDLERYIKRISSTMSFSSNKIGDFLGIKIKQPYIDKEVVDFALDIPLEFKIRKENGKIWGKWILRKAFEDDLPKEIVWQDKRPLEYGSGMSRLRDIIASNISDEEFREKSKSYPVKFINKEHLYFYEVYRDVIGEIPAPKENEKACPYCSGGMDISSFHCRICGGVLDWRN